MKSVRTEKQENIKASRWLLFWFFVLFSILGSFIVIAMAFTMEKEFDWNRTIIYILLFLLFSGIYTAISYFSMTSKTIKKLRTRPTHSAQYRKLSNIVEELAMAGNMPVPNVVIVADPSPNAFAMGSSPENSTIAVTDGLMNLLNREELEAVVGHELAHIKNYDTRLSTLAVALSSVVVGWGSALMNIGYETLYLRDTDDDDDDDHSGFLFALVSLAVGAIVFYISKPVTLLLQRALSREREYLADASSTEFTHNPLGMIKALMMIDTDKTSVTTIKDPSVVELALVTPRFRTKGLSKKEQKELKNKNKWDTHPPIEKRIQRMYELLGTDDSVLQGYVESRLKNK